MPTYYAGVKLRSWEAAPAGHAPGSPINPDSYHRCDGIDGAMAWSKAGALVISTAVGIDGRVGRRLEGELTEGALVEQTNNFVDTLVEGFAILDELIRGKVSPEHLRKTSLLGSTTMLRVLAGVYHDLATDLEDDEIAEFFAKLAPVTAAPIEENSPWLETGVFSVGATAPKARRQDLKTLTDKIARWARTEPAWVKAA